MQSYLLIFWVKLAGALWIIGGKLGSSLIFYFVAIDLRSTIHYPRKMRAETYTCLGHRVPQRVKSEAPKSRVAGTQTYFLFPVSVFQRGAPKGPQNFRLQNLKIEAPKSRAPNVFSMFQRGIQTMWDPPITEPQNKRAGPQKVFCSFFGPKRGQKNHRGQKISKFAVLVLLNTIRLLNFVEDSRGLYGRKIAIFRGK